MSKKRKRIKLHKILKAQKNKNTKDSIRKHKRMETITRLQSGITFTKAKLPEEMEDIIEELNDPQTIRDVKQARKEYKEGECIPYGDLQPKQANQ